MRRESGRGGGENEREGEREKEGEKMRRERSGERTVMLIDLTGLHRL